MDLYAATEASLWFWVKDFTKITLLMTLLFYGLMYLRTYLTPAVISRTLSRNNWASYPLASVFGVLSPFCSCSSIPLFLGFLGFGVGLGVTLTFLLTSPMVNLVAISLLPTMVGIKITVLYALAAASVALVTGITLQTLGFERFVDRPEMATPPGADKQARWLTAWQRSKDQVWELTPYVAAGTGIGALLHGFIPAGLVSNHASGFLAVPAGVLFGIPIYANVLSALPVVEALLGKGADVPVVIAFLMSTTGLSVPEFIMLKKVLDLRLLVALIAVITVAITGVGYALYLV